MPAPVLEPSRTPLLAWCVQGVRSVDDQVGFVVLLVLCAEEKRHDLPMTLDVADQVEQLPMIRDLLTIAFLELGPLADVMAIPLAQFGRWSDAAQPQVDVRRLLGQTPWPQAVHEHAVAVLIRGWFVDALELDDHV